MKTFSFVILLAMSLAACEKRSVKLTPVHPAGKLADDAGIKDLGKVDLISIIEPILKKAVTENWDKKRLIASCGNPSFERNSGSVTIMDYIQPGPYERKFANIISGATIKLEGDKVVNYSWHYVRFTP
jgi:hypothetical protein